MAWLSITAVLALAAAGQSPPVTALACAPGGEHLLCGSQAGLGILDWPSLSKSDSLPTQLLQVHDLAFSPDGRLVAAAGGTPGEEGVLEVYGWPERTLQWRASPSRDVLYTVAWRDDGAGLAVGSLDGSVVLFDELGHQQQQLQGHSRGVTAVVYLSDERLLSGSLDQTIRSWDVASGRVLRTLDQHTQAVHALALAPSRDESQQRVAASCAEDRTIRFWQPAIGRLLRFVRLEDASPLAAVWVSDRQLAVACTDGRLRVVESSTAGILHDLPGIEGWAYAIAVHPSKQAIIVGGESGQLRIVHLNGKK